MRITLYHIAICCVSYLVTSSCIIPGSTYFPVHSHRIFINTAGSLFVMQQEEKERGARCWSWQKWPWIAPIQHERWLEQFPYHLYTWFSPLFSQARLTRRLVCFLLYFLHIRPVLYYAFEWASLMSTSPHASVKKSHEVSYLFFSSLWESWKQRENNLQWGIQSFFPMYPISSLAVCVVTLYSIIFAQLIQYSSQQTLGTDCHYCTTVHTDAPLKFYCFRSKPKIFLLVIWYALLLYGFWAKDLVSPFIYTTTVAFSYFVDKGWYALNDSLLATSF